MPGLFRNLSTMQCPLQSTLATLPICITGNVLHRTSMPEAPTASRLGCSRSDIVESLRRFSPDPRGSRLPDHTRDAIDIELLGIRYYGFLIANLYNRSRPHMSLGPGIPDPSIQKAELQQHSIPKDHRIVVTPILGGLHHEYKLERSAA